MKFSPYQLNNPLKEKLRSGELAVGTWLNNLSDPMLARMAAVAGMDFISIDNEHGVMGLREVAELCSTARLCGVAALVRPNNPLDLKHNGHLLDVGANGLIIPDVRSAEELDAIIKSMKYFKGGTRGIVSVSYNSSLTPTKKEDLERSDDQTVAVIQIESPQAAEKIDEILSVPGIDVVIVGRGDMAHMMGQSGNMNAPEVNVMVDKVFEAAKRHNIVAGLMCPNKEKGVERVKAGAKFINFSNEQNILIGAYKEFLQAVRTAE